MNGNDPSTSAAFSRLISLMHRLRAPGGCPWDAEQSHVSIKNYLIEEAYEAVEAIERASDDELRDELGDVLLQVVFHAEMAAERGACAIDAVIETLCAKLVRRHPHVFGDQSVGSSKDVVESWARIKAREKAEAGFREAGESGSALDGVPRALPALGRAHRLGRKAADVRFDWDSSAGVREKLAEEISELDAALARDDVEAASSELGDVLFTTASLARKLGGNAEDLLHSALARFEGRFRDMERDFSARGMDVSEATAEQLESAWQHAKQRERRRP